MRLRVVREKREGEEGKEVEGEEGEEGEEWEEVSFASFGGVSESCRGLGGVRDSFKQGNTPSTRAVVSLQTSPPPQWPADVITMMGTGPAVLNFLPLCFLHAALLLTLFWSEVELTAVGLYSQIYMNNCC